MLVFIGMRMKHTLSLRDGSREPGGLFHFPLLILKSSLMIQIGVGPFPLQLFCQYRVVKKLLEFRNDFFTHSHEEIAFNGRNFDLGIWNDGFLTQKTHEEKRNLYPVLHGSSGQQRLALISS